MESSLVLLSGGLDSAVNLAYAAQNHKHISTLTLNYRQKAATKEIQASRKLSEYFYAKHHVIDIPWLAEITSTALVGKKNIPKLTKNELDNIVITKQSASDVWVPNRNGLFLNIAASLCDAWDIKLIYVGFNKEEAVTFPDNSSDFAKIATQAFRFSTRNYVEIKSVTINLTKPEIVKFGKTLNIPFHLIWSCYEGNDKPCNCCESCQRFNRAMEQL